MGRSYRFRWFAGFKRVQKVQRVPTNGGAPVLTTITYGVVLRLAI